MVLFLLIFLGDLLYSLLTSRVEHSLLILVFFHFQSEHLSYIFPSSIDRGIPHNFEVVFSVSFSYKYFKISTMTFFLCYELLDFKLFFINYLYFKFFKYMFLPFTLVLVSFVF